MGLTPRPPAAKEADSFGSGRKPKEREPKLHPIQDAVIVPKETEPTFVTKIAARSLTSRAPTSILFTSDRTHLDLT